MPAASLQGIAQLVRFLIPSYRLSGAPARAGGYRADWEPEAPSGKSMAGVPGVFWRCPAVLQGPSTHNPTLVAGKTLILKNWPIYGRYGHIPSTEARFSNAVRGVSRVICG